MRDLELKMEFCNLRARGISLDKICRLMDLCESTALRWDKTMAEDIEYLQNQKFKKIEKSFCKQAVKFTTLYYKILIKLYKHMLELDLDDLDFDQTLDRFHLIMETKDELMEKVITRYEDLPKPAFIKEFLDYANKIDDSDNDCNNDNEKNKKTELDPGPEKFLDKKSEKANHSESSQKPVPEVKRNLPPKLESSDCPPIIKNNLQPPTQNKMSGELRQNAQNTPNPQNLPIKVNIVFEEWLSKGEYLHAIPIIELKE